MQKRRNTVNKGKKRGMQVGTERAPLIVQESQKEMLYTTVPQMITQMTRDWKLRFVAQTALVGSAFSALLLGQMLGVIATSATTSVYLSNIMRIKRVQIWCLPSAVGTPCTVQAFFPNVPIAGDPFISGPPKPVTDTTLSVDRYAYVSLTPAKNSSIEGKWVDIASGATLLILTVPADGIVEIDYQFIIDDLGLNQAGPALTGAVPGNIYHRITSGLTAQGVNSI